MGRGAWWTARTVRRPGSSGRPRQHSTDRWPAPGGTRAGRPEPGGPGAAPRRISRPTKPAAAAQPTPQPAEPAKPADEQPTPSRRQASRPGSSPDERGGPATRPKPTPDGASTGRPDGAGPGSGGRRTPGAVRTRPAPVPAGPPDPRRDDPGGPRMVPGRQRPADPARVAHPRPGRGGRGRRWGADPGRPPPSRPPERPAPAVPTPISEHRRRPCPADRSRPPTASGLPAHRAAHQRPARCRPAAGRPAGGRPQPAGRSRPPRGPGSRRSPCRRTATPSWSLAQTTPACQLTWTTLAAIGKVESRHGTANGARSTPTGSVPPNIIGAAAGRPGRPHADHGHRRRRSSTATRPTTGRSARCSSSPPPGRNRRRRRQRRRQGPARHRRRGPRSRLTICARTAVTCPIAERLVGRHPLLQRRAAIRSGRVQRGQRVRHQQPA